MATVALGRHRLRGIRIGKNTWYVVANGASRGVLKVSHGVIGEVGIAAKPLTANRRLARMLLAHLG